MPSPQLRLDTLAAMAAELRSLGPASFLYADGDVLFAHADRRLQPLQGQVAAPALYRLECPAEDSLALLRDCQLPDPATAQRMILLISVPLTDEENTKMTFSVNARRVDAHGSKANYKSAEITLDTDLAGRPDAFNPAELLLAACRIKGIERVTPILKFELRGVEVRLHGVRQDVPPRMESIDI